MTGTLIRCSTALYIRLRGRKHELHALSSTQEHIGVADVCIVEWFGTPIVTDYRTLATPPLSREVAKGIPLGGVDMT
jgi:hypothetical protein